MIGSAKKPFEWLWDGNEKCNRTMLIFLLADFTISCFMRKNMLGIEEIQNRDSLAILGSARVYDCSQSYWRNFLLSRKKYIVQRFSSQWGWI